MTVLEIEICVLFGLWIILFCVVMFYIGKQIDQSQKSLLAQIDKATGELKKVDEDINRLITITAHIERTMKISTSDFLYGFEKKILQALTVAHKDPQKK
jgi:hypothetical protein